MVFIPNFSTLKGRPQEEEENDEAYALSQEQRALERKVRAEKRDLEVLKAQGADEKAIQAQKAKIDKANAELAEFCTDHELPRRKNREFTPVNATWPVEDDLPVRDDIM